MSEHVIVVTANGRRYEASVEARRTLADFLREDLGLTGTHLGCEHGACGACSVLINGVAARACIMLAVQADGSEVMTIEGIAGPEALHPLQQAFRECHSFQCGFCTPGFVIEAYALLEQQSKPNEQEIREALAGNLCRCTGYESIVRGVLLASSRLEGGDGRTER